MLTTESLAFALDSLRFRRFTIDGGPLVVMVTGVRELADGTLFADVHPVIAHQVGHVPDSVAVSRLTPRAS